MFSKKIFNLTNLTLVTALTLSIIAAWYSILGLVAIFAAAVIPIIIMGTALEVSKVVTTVWLHAYWDRVKWSMRLYLVFAVISLAFLTSMGIFGFLSKAHSDQSLVSGDVQAKIALYDEKIRIAKENIDANRRALKQMDEAVDQVMGRSTTEQGAERSVQIRRQQSPERQRLIREIETEQKKISSLNEERAPIAAEVRKVEAEVGPIKYIAALIYGDNPEANLLERAVRWVIILIVFVFDPLALTLVLAANESRRWDKEKLSEKRHTLVEEKDNTLEVDKFIEPIDSQPKEEPYVTYPVQEKTEEIVKEEQVQPTLYRKKWVDKVPGIRVPHQVYKPVVPPKPEPETLKCVKCGSTLEFIKGFGNFCVNNECDLTNLPEEPKEVQIVEVANNFEIKTENVTKVLPWKESEGGYVVYDGKSMKKDVFQSLHPEMFRLTADRDIKITTNFGVEFPKVAFKGDVFVRVDALPNKVFKFDGIKWIEISKQNNDSYIQDEEYVKYLIQKISSGELDVEMLTEKEKLFLENYLSQKP